MTKYWEALAQLHLVGGRPSPGDSGYVAYGLRIAGSIEALSLTVRDHGGVVYEDTTNAGHAVVVLPLHVPLQALGQSFTNTKGQVRILDAWAYGPPA